MSSTTTESIKLVDARELAGLLGISIRTVWRMVAAGELPSPVRLGGGRIVRWRLARVQKYVEQLDGFGGCR